MGNLTLKFKRSPDPVLNGTAALKIRYNVERTEIGSGLAGRVYKCTDKVTNRFYACKKISIIATNNSNVHREILILNILKGSHRIVSIHEFFEDSLSVHIVTELCLGGELHQQIIKKAHTASGRFSEREAAIIMRQVLEAVVACHSGYQVVHRDLKPDNFLLRREDDISDICLIDFGLSRVFKKNQRMHTLVGSVYYAAPEVWNGSYDESCDMWSVGVIMYLVLSSSPPFDGQTDDEILEAARIGQPLYLSSTWLSISKEAKSLISKLLSKVPRNRPTAIEALEDPWFARFDTSDEVDDQHLMKNEYRPSLIPVKTTTSRSRARSSSFEQQQQRFSSLPENAPALDNALKSAVEISRKKNSDSSMSEPPSPRLPPSPFMSSAVPDAVSRERRPSFRLDSSPSEVSSSPSSSRSKRPPPLIVSTSPGGLSGIRRKSSGSSSPTLQGPTPPTSAPSTPRLRGLSMSLFDNGGFSTMSSFDLSFVAIPESLQPFAVQIPSRPRGNSQGSASSQHSSPPSPSFFLPQPPPQQTPNSLRRRLGTDL